MKLTITFRSKRLLITAVLILALSFQVPSAAENHRTNKINESYYRISETPGTLFNHKPMQRESSLAISPDEVLYNFKQKQKFILIDVRNPEDFKRLHIPGSLNIPLYAVKTKAFLKSYPIVLINEGFRYRLLETECQQLTGLGFKAFILDGGLLAWKRKGSQLAGDLFALEEMQVISPQVFFQEKECGNTLVIDISPVQTEISRQLMSYSRHIPVSPEPAKWVRKLNRIIAEHKDQHFLSVVVFNETGGGYGSVNQISAGLTVNVFFLQGGVVGYKRFLQDLMLSWLPRDRRIKTNRRCRTCSVEIGELIP